MDYVRHGEIQGRFLVFFRAHCPCILPCLTKFILRTQKMGRNKNLKSPWLQAKTFLKLFPYFKSFSVLYLLCFAFFSWLIWLHPFLWIMNRFYMMVDNRIYFYQISLDLSFVGHDLNWGHMPLGMQYTKKVGRHTSFECNL